MTPTPPTDADKRIAREWVAKETADRVDRAKARGESVYLERWECYAAGLAAGRAGLTWTGTPPMEARPCWWRSSPQKKGAVAELCYFNGELCVDVMAGNSRRLFCPVADVPHRYPDCQWCPIPAPTES